MKAVCQVKSYFGLFENIRAARPDATREEAADRIVVLDKGVVAESGSLFFHYVSLPILLK